MRQLKINETITKRSVNIERYFRDVGPDEKLTADEEFEIAKLASTGDQAALDILVKRNLRFVISVAKQYSHSSEMLGELIAQGNIGLIDAAKTFDPSRGFKFISYAVWHIRKEILSYFNDYNRLVRLPTNVILDLNRAKKIETSISTKLGRDATFEEIAAEMNVQGWPITSDKLEFIRSVSENSVPLESQNPDEERSPIQWLAGEDNTTRGVDTSDRTRMIAAVLERLTPVERDVIVLRHGLHNGIEESFSFIALKYERTTEWARQVYTRGIKRSKQNLSNLKMSEESI
jgi:RNA polymerase primary sigma factor